MDVMSAIRKIEELQDEAKEIDKWLHEQCQTDNLKWKEVIEVIKKISQNKWNEAWNLRCKIDQATKGISLD